MPFVCVHPSKKASRRGVSMLENPLTPRGPDLHSNTRCWSTCWSIDISESGWKCPPSLLPQCKYSYGPPAVEFETREHLLPGDLSLPQFPRRWGARARAADRSQESSPLRFVPAAAGEAVAAAAAAAAVSPDAAPCVASAASSVARSSRQRTEYLLGPPDTHTLFQSPAPPPLSYATALRRDPSATLDDLREAVTTLEETELIARRVLGGSHPLVANFEQALRYSREALSARETPPPGDTSK
jgi:hypothetical protein